METMANGRTARATINDVAEAAAVSRQTVSNALNNPERVKPDTLQRVNLVIDRLGYRPSSAAQTLRQQRAGAVGIELNAVGSTRSDIPYPFLLALSLAAPRNQCHLVPFASRESTPTLTGYQDMVRRHLVDAFVISDTHADDPRPIWLSEHRIPYAAFGRIHDDPTVTTWADVDGQVGTQEAVEHLVERGYDRIGYLGWPAGSAVGDERRRGWVEATERHAIRTTPEAITLQGIREAAAAADPLLDHVGRGGAVVCASDALAAGVVHAAMRRGWVTGRDVGIVGFDASGTAEMLGLTTLAQPLDLIADHCLALVHNLLAGADPPATGALFTPILIVGDSTDPSKKGTP